MRQSQGSTVCPECGRLVQIDDEKCPFCGRWQPALFGFGPALQRIFGVVDVTQSIVWSCVVLYLLSLILDPSAVARSFGFGLMGIGAPSDSALVQLGMTGRQMVSMWGFWWTPLSATFLHGSLLHIFFNMMWLRALGPLLENSLGPARFFLLYIVSGVVGFAVSNTMSLSPSVGASGAIFGLLAATIVLARHHGGAWGAAVGQQAMMWAGLLFLLGFLSARTNNWAHAGGFAAGFVLSRILVRQAHRPEGPFTQIAALAGALACIGAVVATFVIVRSA